MMVMMMVAMMRENECSERKSHSVSCRRRWHFSSFIFDLVCRWMLRHEVCALFVLVTRVCFHVSIRRHLVLEEQLINFV